MHIYSFSRPVKAAKFATKEQNFTHATCYNYGWRFFDLQPILMAKEELDGRRLRRIEHFVLTEVGKLLSASMWMEQGP